MEPETRAFLQRIAFTIFGLILWMSINSTIGIMYNYAFVEEKITIGNILFYIWLIASLILLIWFYIKLWKTPPEEEENS